MRIFLGIVEMNLVVMCKTHGHIKSLENVFSRINCHELIKYLPRPKFGCYYFPTKYWATEDEENLRL